MSEARMSEVQTRIQDVRQRLSRLNLAVSSSTVASTSATPAGNSSPQSFGQLRYDPPTGSSSTPSASRISFAAAAAPPSHNHNAQEAQDSHHHADMQRLRLDEMRSRIQSQIHSEPSYDDAPSRPAPAGPPTSSGASNFSDMQKQLRDRLAALNANSSQPTPQHVPPTPHPQYNTGNQNFERNDPRSAAPPPSNGGGLLSHITGTFSNGDLSPVNDPRAMPPQGLVESPAATNTPGRPGQGRRATSQEGAHTPRTSRAPQMQTNRHQSPRHPVPAAKVATNPPRAPFSNNESTAAARAPSPGQALSGSGGPQAALLSGAEVFAILRLRGLITSTDTTGEQRLPPQPCHTMQLSPYEIQQLNQLRESLRQQAKAAPRGMSDRRVGSDGANGGGSNRAPTKTTPRRAASAKAESQPSRWR